MLYVKIDSKKTEIVSDNFRSFELKFDGVKFIGVLPQKEDMQKDFRKYVSPINF